jgi:dihydrofolate synthase/folylpolyglutamate synthase
VHLNWIFSFPSCLLPLPNPPFKSVTAYRNHFKQRGSINLIDSLLSPYQRFGVNLGLTRIQQLLAGLGNPHHQVPILHIAGTNGKGSVCAYLSSVLTEAGYKVGRYTSPHLVDWTERICLNEIPIPTAEFEGLLHQIREVTDTMREKPTLFEVVTAAAWLYFAQQQADIAVMEVGLGGRLDATNVVESPLVTAIVSLSREHWQNLGNTVAEIAGEKAGILKGNCPVVIGQLPPEATKVVKQRVKALDCPAVWVQPAQEIPQEGLGLQGAEMNSAHSPSRMRWASYEGIEYPLPLLGEMQLVNSAIAISILRILQAKGWNIPPEAIQQGMAKTRWLGRLQWFSYQQQDILIDGAHNPAAAQVLRRYVDTLKSPVTWVMGMLSTKEHSAIFEALLRPGDSLYLLPVLGHSSADPEELGTLGQQICPELASCQTKDDVFSALDLALQQLQPVVLCGSLYLIGEFFRVVGDRE